MQKLVPRRVMADLGSRIIELRANNSLTQEQLAELADVSVSQLKRIERGASNPTVETLVALCNALRVDLPMLFSAPTRVAERRVGRPRRRLK